MIRAFTTMLTLFLLAAVAHAQTGSIAGVVRDETDGALPGATVQLFTADRMVSESVSGPDGGYRIDRITPGKYSLRLSLVNFSRSARDVIVRNGEATRADIVMHLTFGAAITVTGKSTFGNLADAERPAENLVGIAQSASQGAITARQLDARPIMRSGEVLETVPGVIISQHSGEGKANQYYLRGFNLDHGTDFATTVAGMPVNMPTHAHGQGYSDLNFLIPELVSGVQYSKGPYFADQGDFATAGAANINYVNTVGKPIVRVAGGGEGFTRALVAASPRVGRGHLLAALEVEHNDGPWTQPDDYRKVNAIVRYSQRRRAERLFRHRHGISRHVELHRSDTGARRRRVASSIGSVQSIPPTAATRIATADRSNGSGRVDMRARRSRPSASATTSICSPTSLTFSTTRITAISFTRPITGS